MNTPKDDAGKLRKHADSLREFYSLYVLKSKNTAADLLEDIAARLATVPAYPEKPAIDWSKPLRTVGGGDIQVELIEAAHPAFDRTHPRYVKLSRGDWRWTFWYSEAGVMDSAVADHPWNLTNAAE